MEETQDSWLVIVTEYGKSIAMNLYAESPLALYLLALIMFVVVCLCLRAIVLTICRITKFSIYEKRVHVKEDWENSIVEFNMDNYKVK